MCLKGDGHDRNSTKWKSSGTISPAPNNSVNVESILSSTRLADFRLRYGFVIFLDAPTVCTNFTARAREFAGNPSEPFIVGTCVDYDALRPESNENTEKQSGDVWNGNHHRRRVEPLRPCARNFNAFSKLIWLAQIRLNVQTARVD